MKIIYSAFNVPSNIYTTRQWLGMPSEQELIIMAEAAFGKTRMLYPDTETVFYCDEYFKNLLGHIPFDRIEVLNIYLPATMWAAGKFYAMEKQDEEFYHLDFDLFLERQLPNLDCVGLAWEGYHSYAAYPNGAREMSRAGFLPDFVKYHIGDEHCYAICSAIIGGKDHSFFVEYARQCLHVINNHIDFFNDEYREAAVGTSYMVVVEQLFYAAFLKVCNKHVHLFRHHVEDAVWSDGFSGRHLFGNFKYKKRDDHNFDGPALIQQYHEQVKTAGVI